MKNKYDVDYFIKKFTAIPEDNWVTGVYRDDAVGCCAAGWCGERDDRSTDESRALTKLVYGVDIINDGKDSNFPPEKYSTPKKRILAALYYVKNRA